eukprot:COSAG06_NODE_49493_length_325_cov_0.650442_1_plen_54_part_10
MLGVMLTFEVQGSHTCALQCINALAQRQCRACLLVGGHSSILSSQEEEEEEEEE